MVDRPKKPSALSSTPANLPQATVNISDSTVTATLPSGSSVEILLFGATVISWKNASGDEKLWLSKGALLDGSKAVRGGIPVVFPVFGPPSPSHAATASLPQHGFARTSRWEFLGKSTSESETSTATQGDNSVKLDFGLSSSNISEESKKAWPFDFGLIYSVTLSKDSLTTSIVVQNAGEKAWEFQTLLHTYLKVKNISDISVTGLESSPFHDKVTAVAENTSPASEALKFTSKLDRVYTPAGGPSKPIVVSEAGSKKFEVVRDNLNEVVVWNPWTDCKDIGDFKPVDGYKEMVCVEAGAVKGWLTLDQGEAFEGGVTIISA